MFKKLLLTLSLISVYLMSSNANALVRIDINQGNIDPLPFALAPLGSPDKRGELFAQSIAEVTANNLERSGLFRAMDERAFLEDIKDANTFPNFGNWRKINATLLISGYVKLQPGNLISLEFRLWDVYAGKSIAGKLYTTEQNNWRRIAHMMSDEIYKTVTGEDGYFDTRIVYVSERGPRRKRIKQLAIMDQDGANHKFLTNGRNLALTPRFSSNMQQIIYLSYAQDRPRVYIRDLETGREIEVGNFPGMTFAPRFAPDDTKVLMSASLDGNSEIYEYDLQSKQKKRLTFDDAIDTSPSFSPNQKRIVFNSDRGGSQQIYVMDRNGKNVERISFGKGRYGSPVWSPRGDLIAFTKMYQGKFYIGVMKPDGSSERLLTESFMDESPTWAPNGRLIIFTRQTKSTIFNPSTSKLYSIDITGYNERVVPTPNDASDPAWSPLM